MSHTADSSRQRTILKPLCLSIRNSKCLIGTYLQFIFTGCVPHSGCRNEEGCRVCLYYKPQSYTENPILHYAFTFSSNDHYSFNRERLADIQALYGRMLVNSANALGKYASHHVCTCAILWSILLNLVTV